MDGTIIHRLEFHYLNTTKESCGGKQPIYRNYLQVHTGYKN